MRWGEVMRCRDLEQLWDQLTAFKGPYSRQGQTEGELSLCMNVRLVDLDYSESGHLIYDSESGQLVTFTALHCTALPCTALYCTALHCTALHCTALHWGDFQFLCNLAAKKRGLDRSHKLACRRNRRETRNSLGKVYIFILFYIMYGHEQKQKLLFLGRKWQKEVRRIKFVGLTKYKQRSEINWWELSCRGISGLSWIYGSFMYFKQTWSLSPP